MGIRMSVDYRQLKDFQKKLQMLERETQNFIIKELEKIAKKLIDEVIAKTPKEAEELIKGWKANDITVIKQGNTYITIIKNECPYASMVEYGHKSANGLKWVKGRFILKLTEAEIEKYMNTQIVKDLQIFFNSKIGV